MNKKIGIATLYTGFNYGSSLQAYAVKLLFEEFGYTTEIFKVKGSIVKGRDIRLKKLLVMLFRSCFVKNGIKQIKGFRDSYTKKNNEENKKKFNEFTINFLTVKELSYSKMKKVAINSDYVAFVCGSDQIWNTTSLYVDPFYYLQFAPKKKRIAFVPSFGKEFIPTYNEKKIKKYVSEIPYKSIREISGAKLVKQLTGEEIPILLDPTLLLDVNVWCERLNLYNGIDSPYLLTYFLDSPNRKTIKTIKTISEKYNLKVVNLPYGFEELSFCETIQGVGPVEFVNIVKNASFICTDSFHGTAFALNFNIPFYTFERNYGLVDRQSTRIYSLLGFTKMLDRYEPKNIENCLSLSFENVNELLQKERNKAWKYIKECLADISAKG